MNHQTWDMKDAKCFARKRTNKDKWDKCILACTFLGVGCWLTPDSRFTYLSNSSAYSYLYLMLMEVISRISSLREEYSHLESRYKKSSMFLFIKIFTMNQSTRYCLFFAGAVVFVREFVKEENILQYAKTTGVMPWLFSFAGIKFLTDLIELDESTVKVAKIIDRCNGLDYGSGMAVNCFYGYLNFMLPATGEARKGLKENIEDFSSNHQVNTFASTKLYLFLPLSAKCPPNAADYSPHKILEQSEIIEPKEINRGGVRKRRYHNTAYKIKTSENERPIYVCCEFASALQTLHEVMKHDHELSAFYKEHQKELVTNFYIALQKLIKEKDFTNMCELIFFQDKDEDGSLLYETRLDIGDLLLRKLRISSNGNG